ncbi:MAG TPA: HAD hydrolase-like protein, partial [Gemmatimonadaceae bacterium]
TVEDHKLVTARLDQLLREDGATIDASYFCPHGPEDGCDCRKPGALLFRNAQHDHPEINLSRALYIGDRYRDIEPGIHLGGTGVLVPSPETPQSEIDVANARARVAPSLATALDWFLCTN